MNRLTRLAFAMCLPWLLASCGTPGAVPPTAAPTPVPPTAVEQSEQESPLPFSEPGPYHASRRSYVAEDPGRDNRKVYITVWYPAIYAEGASDTPFDIVFNDLEPDAGGAPYPLILSSTTMARTMAAHLVSHGFAWASVDRIDTYAKMNEEMYSQPLDILFALDQVAAHPPEGLEGIIDADHVGAIGYSFDGYNTLAMSGARVDPDYYRAQCPEPDATTAAILGGMSAYNCAPADAWEAFAAGAGETITTSEDGLWQPITDPRIRAVMPLACEGWWVFGARGLAAVDRPTLMIAGTDDELYAENALIYKHLGTPDKAFISFVGRGHMIIFDDEMVARMAHFAAAFFGTHLQGRQELSQYFSEDAVSRFDDLAWGVVQGE